MAFLFGKKQKSPADLIKHIKEHLTVYDKANANPKAVDKVPVVHI